MKSIQLFNLFYLFILLCFIEIISQYNILYSIILIDKTGIPVEFNCSYRRAFFWSWLRHAHRGEYRGGQRALSSNDWVHPIQATNRWCFSGRKIQPNYFAVKIVPAIHLILKGIWVWLIVFSKVHTILLINSILLPQFTYVARQLLFFAYFHDIVLLH